MTDDLDTTTIAELPEATPPTWTLGRRRSRVRLPVLVPGEKKPITRGDCERVARPCGWSDCRYHLPTACVLDVADEGGRTLEQVAALVAMSREGVRVIETKALDKVRLRLAAIERASIAIINGHDQTWEIDRDEG